MPIPTPHRLLKRDLERTNLLQHMEDCGHLVLVEWNNGLVTLEDPTTIKDSWSKFIAAYTIRRT